MTKKKEELTTDECIVICDFSENYADYTDFANLTHHLKDFDLDAEWHFFPTQGGTVKRLTARPSLQRVTNPIQTPWELIEVSSKYNNQIFN